MKASRTGVGVVVGFVTLALALSTGTATAQEEACDYPFVDCPEETTTTTAGDELGVGGENPPGGGEVAPGEGEVAPGEGEGAPGGGEVGAPGEGEVAPNEGEVAPDDAAAPETEVVGERAQAAPSGTLPFTGGDVTGLVIIGAVAVGAGALLLRRSRATAS